MSTAALPRPSFIDRDPVSVQQAIVDAYETATGRTLQPGQVESLLIDVMAYIETLVRAQIQYAGEQNLVAYAQWPMLDLLAEQVGVTRLPAQAATTTLQFTLTGVQVVPVVIPVGTRVRSSDGLVIFATNANLIIAPGNTTGTIIAHALTAGASGNGYAANSVTDLLDTMALVASATNTTTSANGGDEEADDPLRERIRNARAAFSTAGSIAAYRYFAMSTSPRIVDVGISSPTPGAVHVVVLADTGIPSAELLTAVANALNAETVRPLTDTVTVSAPTAVTYAITATIQLLKDTDPTSVMAAAQAAADAYVADRSAKLGRDVVVSQIIAALSVPGVYRVDLSAPAIDADVDADEWATCTAITLTQGDLHDG